MDQYTYWEYRPKCFNIHAHWAVQPLTSLSLQRNEYSVIMNCNNNEFLGRFHLPSASRGSIPKEMLILQKKLIWLQCELYPKHVRRCIRTFTIVLLETGTNFAAVNVNCLLAEAMMNTRQRWNETGVPTQSQPQAASRTLSAWNKRPKIILDAQRKEKQLKQF
jgi:hypothetical protein